MFHQASIKESVKVEGINIYRGRKNHVVFYPSEENTGLVFRVDKKEIKATLSDAYNLRKSISLNNGQIKVYLIEHLLSAVYVLGIDNLVIELSDNTCPTTDNCAEEFFTALKELRTFQPEKKTFWTVKPGLEITIRSEEERRPDYLSISPSDSFIIDYLAYYPHEVVGEQRFRFKAGKELYQREIMAARSPAFIYNSFFKEVFLFLVS